MIREATIQDIPEMVRLFQGYTKEIKIDCAEAAISPNIVSKRFKDAIDIGLCFVAEEGALTGLVVGSIGFNVWSDRVLEINMLCLYVDEEHRKGTTGGRLLIRYLRACDEKKSDNNNIKGIWTQFQQDTNIREDNMKKQGFKLADITFFKE